MMNIEDMEPMKKKLPPKNLDEMSIEALCEYIADMESEIYRVREAIKVKKEAQNKANSVFKG